ncbi:BQ2448_7314 [Microbotryum intermedium]|uniref:BQ2448_7314 protein n=1 Tax=Microbotryum intermedium TaxID=269621 RepID=A0A238FQA7_9BASI|nr:BQ2448_7314 [Microbotryum intermedium]
MTSQTINRASQLVRHLSTMSNDVLSKPGLVLLTAGTPNGHKVSMFLEELVEIGAIKAYEFKAISFAKNEQKEPWFLKVNPNGRIPALIDNREGKKPINVWESASILLYLARTYDTKYEFHFEDPDLQTEMMNWIFFVQGGVGPMQGQANHFFRYAPEKVPYGINRYQNETKRLYSVYEQHLSEDNEYLVGNKYSIADMCTQPWLVRPGIPLADYPKLNAWVERIDARPAANRGYNIPDEDKKPKWRNNPEAAEKMAKEAAKWVST